MNVHYELESSQGRYCVGYWGRDESFFDVGNWMADNDSTSISLVATTQVSTFGAG